MNGNDAGGLHQTTIIVTDCFKHVTGRSKYANNNKKKKKKHLYNRTTNRWVHTPLALWRTNVVQFRERGWVDCNNYQLLEIEHVYHKWTKTRCCLLKINWKLACTIVVKTRPHEIFEICVKMVIVKIMIK